MLRNKEPRTVVTVRTTTDAMRAEAAARTHGLDGRLIPVPREITAGCGLAWSAPVHAEEALRALYEAEHIGFQEIHRLTI